MLWTHQEWKQRYLDLIVGSIENARVIRSAELFENPLQHSYLLTTTMTEGVTFVYVDSTISSQYRIKDPCEGDVEADISLSTEAVVVTAFELAMLERLVKVWLSRNDKM